MMNKELYGKLHVYQNFTPFDFAPIPNSELENDLWDYLHTRYYNDRRFFELLHIDFG